MTGFGGGAKRRGQRNVGRDVERGTPRIRRRARESKALKFVHGRGKSAFAYLTTTVVPAGPAIASADIVGVASVRHVAPAIPDRDAPLTLDTVYSRVSKNENTLVLSTATCTEMPASDDVA